MSGAIVRWIVMLCGGLLSTGAAWTELQAGERQVTEKTPFYLPGSDTTKPAGDFEIGDRVTVLAVRTLNARSWAFVRSVDGIKSGYVRESALEPIAPEAASSVSTSAGGAPVGWNGDAAEEAPGYSNWVAMEKSSFSPHLPIEASSLAFTPDGKALFVVLEKSPAILRFDVERNGAPALVQLDLPIQLDIEGISILGDQIYLIDEDSCQIYMTPVTPRSQPSPIRYFSSGVGQDVEEANRSGDRHSLEGIVVHSQFLGPKRAAPNADRPYVYLLDERDRAGDRYEARLYVGTLGKRGGGDSAASAERISLWPGVVRFDLGPVTQNYRLSDLFEHRGQLYALKTKFSPRPEEREYEVVRCLLDPPELKVVCKLTTEARRRARELGESNNFEGAGVAPAGRHFGKLFLTADNAQTAGGTRLKEDARGQTPLIMLPPVLSGHAQ